MQPEIDGEEDEGVLMVLSNDPTEFKVRTLELLYQAASYGGIAYMDGKDPDTGEIVPLLVGIKQEGENKFSIWPFARIFATKDIKQYLVPDGAGNYSEPNFGDPAEEEGTPSGISKNQIN